MIVQDLIFLLFETFESPRGKILYRLLSSVKCKLKYKICKIRDKLTISYTEQLRGNMSFCIDKKFIELYALWNQIFTMTGEAANEKPIGGKYSSYADATHSLCSRILTMLNDVLHLRYEVERSLQ